MKEYTLEEIAQCTGEDGKPALIACNGKVYDVSDNYHWRGGRHQVLHRAGTDLTAELKHAPHGAQLLEKVPVVGTLRQG
jgi:predicted heme/steroid binding protein